MKAFGIAWLLTAGVTIGSCPALGLGALGS